MHSGRISISPCRDCAWGMSLCGKAFSVVFVSFVIALFVSFVCAWLVEAVPHVR
jgi:hypothetical protein